MAAEDITTTYTYEPTSEVEVLEVAAQAAGADVLTDPVRVTADSDEWSMRTIVDAIAGSLAVTLQESVDYDPNVHATPGDAHWFNSAETGTAADPITAAEQGAYAAYHRAPLERYVRLKYTLGGSATFGVKLAPKSRQANLDG